MSHKIFSFRGAIAAAAILFAGFGQSIFAQTFVHPGGLHTRADLDRMKARVAAGEHPWIDDWNNLIADPRARNTWHAAPQANMESRQRAQDDAAAAYLNALRWYISGDTTFAECAVRNLNSWSAAVNQVPSGPDQPGLGGIPIGNFALAAEVLRTYPGWSEEAQARFKKMLLTYFYPQCNTFLTKHNGACASFYWANWDTANILALLAIGVYCDDRAIFDQGIAYFRNGAGNGSIGHAVPFLHAGGLGQWQESGRDQGHAFLGLGQLSEACQVAWNQGVDLFACDNNRLLAGAEYLAQYASWKGVPYTFYNNCANANQYYVAPNYHGRLEASNYELLYNHYVVLKGLKAPNVKQFAELKRPEPGDRDILGYGTLAYTLKASPYPVLAVPPVPRDLNAAAGLGSIGLAWSPAGSYSTTGYAVSRATAAVGPYTVIYSTTDWTTPSYTDVNVTDGTRYFYEIAAINASGTSAKSSPAAATPSKGGPPPEGWTHEMFGITGDAGRTIYSDAQNQTFQIMPSGREIGGTTDSCSYDYRTVTGDFTVTARLIERRGMINAMGLMMRESTAADAKMLALTLGDIGGREARVRERPATGMKAAMVQGDDYTWLPVWFRLQRAGNQFTASQSSDGITWFAVAAVTIPMPGRYLAGLAVSSGGPTSKEHATAAFDHVVLDVTPPPPPDAPGGLAAAPLGGDEIQLSWRNKGANQTGIKIEASTGNALFYEIADLPPGATSFVNTGLSDPAAMSYRVRAYNTGGYSAYSNAASPVR